MSAPAVLTVDGTPYAGSVVTTDEPMTMQFRLTRPSLLDDVLQTVGKRGTLEVGAWSVGVVVTSFEVKGETFNLLDLG